MRVTYLNAAGAMVTATVSMAGTTGVSLGTGVSYVQWIEVASLGSLPNAAGNITVSTVVEPHHRADRGVPPSGAVSESVRKVQGSHRSCGVPPHVGRQRDREHPGPRAPRHGVRRPYAERGFYAQDDTFLPGNSSQGGRASLGVLPRREIKAKPIPGPQRATAQASTSTFCSAV